MAFKLGDKHAFKWQGINYALHMCGYRAAWQHDHMTEQYKYAIFKQVGPKKDELLGVYNSEDEAEAMCRLLISQSKYEG